MKRLSKLPWQTQAWRQPAWQMAALAGLVLLAILRSMAGTQLDGLTLDEPYHLLAAVAYAEHGAYQLNPEHPPLVKRVAGAALMSELQLPATYSWTNLRLRNKLEERNLAERVVYLQNDAERIQARVRAAMFGLHGVLLLALLILVRRIFGFAWAAVTGAWLALDPTVGAHMPLVMTDLSPALCLSITALLAALVLDLDSHPSLSGPRVWVWTTALGVAAGLALASKFSTLPGLGGLAAFCLAAGVVRARRSDERVSHATGRMLVGALVVALVALATLWASYGFRFHAAPDGSDPFHRPLEAQIEELNLPLHASALRLADRWHLVPRAYLWGLADALRAGVEGRGQSRHVLFGHFFEGEPPWFFWPGILTAKIPLPHLLLVLCGTAAICWLSAGEGAPRQRLALLSLTALALAHGFALLTSRGTYGGVRHALPLLVVAAVLAGGIVRLRRSSWPRGAALVPLLLLTTTLAFTAAEPRLWEYHNALAGGTRNAAELFENEGVHLGQRLPEVAGVWHDDELGEPNRPLYALLPVSEEEARSLDLPLTRRVPGIDDTNVRGRYEGFFLVSAGWRRHRHPWSEDLEALDTVVRLGNVELLAGAVSSPQLRASGLLQTVGEYLNATPRPDWPTLELRMEELVEVRPDSTSGWILLGDARVALRQRSDAVDAFRRALETLTEGDPARDRLQKHMALLESGAPLDQVPFLPPVSAE